MKSRKQFHSLFWEQAAVAYQSSQYEEALMWYNYSLSLFPVSSPTDKVMGKLQVGGCGCVRREGGSVWMCVWGGCEGRCGYV